MNPAKAKRMEQAGWVVGDVSTFLGLTSEESRFVEMKLALAKGLRELRDRQGMTQSVVARRLGSSQSRVAKMEAADGAVSFDLLMRSLLAMGATPAEIARWIRRAHNRQAA